MIHAVLPFPRLLACNFFFKGSGGASAIKPSKAAKAATVAAAAVAATAAAAIPEVLFPTRLFLLKADASILKQFYVRLPSSTTHEGLLAIVKGKGAITSVILGHGTADILDDATLGDMALTLGIAAGTLIELDFQGRFRTIEIELGDPAGAAATSVVTGQCELSVSLKTFLASLASTFVPPPIFARHEFFFGLDGIDASILNMTLSSVLSTWTLDLDADDVVRFSMQPLT